MNWNIFRTSRASETQILYIQSLLHQFPTDYPDESTDVKERELLDEALADMPQVVGRVDPVRYRSFKRLTKAQASTVIDRLNSML